LKSYNDILFQRKVLWDYIMHYSPRMLLKMIAGSYRVTKQYKRKIKEAYQYA
jgi:hypothetical protein